MKAIQTLTIITTLLCVASVNAAGAGRIKIRTEKNKLVNSGSMEAIQKANKSGAINEVKLLGNTPSATLQFDYKGSKNSYINSGRMTAKQDATKSGAINRVCLECN